MRASLLRGGRPRGDGHGRPRAGSQRQQPRSPRAVARAAARRQAEAAADARSAAAGATCRRAPASGTRAAPARRRLRRGARAAAPAQAHAAGLRRRPRRGHDGRGRGVVAEAERAAAARLAEVQARWERRLASADRRARRRRHAGSTRPPCRSPTRSATRSSARSSPWSRTCSAASSRWPTPPASTRVRRALTLVPGRRPRRRPAAPRRPRPRSRRRRWPSCPAAVAVVGDPAVERAGAVAETGAAAHRRPARARARAGPGGPRRCDRASAARCAPRARAAARPQVTGSVSGAMGLTLTVDGVTAAVGDLVEVNPGERGRCSPRWSPSAATG